METYLTDNKKRKSIEVIRKEGEHDARENKDMVCSWR